MGPHIFPLLRVSPKTVPKNEGRFVVTTDTSDVQRLGRIWKKLSPNSLSFRSTREVIVTNLGHGPTVHKISPLNYMFLEHCFQNLLVFSVYVTCHSMSL